LVDYRVSIPGRESVLYSALSVRIILEIPYLPVDIGALPLGLTVKLVIRLNLDRRLSIMLRFYIHYPIRLLSLRLGREAVSVAGNVLSNLI
jgi:hypothetical protein